MENSFSELEILKEKAIARQIEKTGIRRIANVLGFAYCGVLAISFGWRFPLLCRSF